MKDLLVEKSWSSRVEVSSWSLKRVPTTSECGSLKRPCLCLFKNTDLFLWAVSYFTKDLIVQKFFFFIVSSFSFEIIFVFFLGGKGEDNFVDRENFSVFPSIYLSCFFKAS